MRLLELERRAPRLRLARLLRSAVGSVPGWFVLVLAGLGFFLLSRGAAFGTLPALGFAEALDSSVASLQPGRIQSLAVQLGQHVKAGQVLVELDRRGQDARCDMLRAELARAEAVLAAQRGIQDAAVTRGELWALRVSAAERGDRAELRVLDRQMQIFQSLSDERLVTPLQVSEAERRRQAIEARITAYDTARAHGRAGLDPGRYSAESHAQTVALRLAPYEQAVEAARAELRQAEVQLDELTLRAAVDGSISAIVRHPGEVVAAGSEIVRVLSGRRGAVQVSVPEATAARIGVGSRVRVRRSGFWSHLIGGTVVELSPQIDEAPPRARASPNVPAWGRRVVVQTAASDLLPGEQVYVVF